MGGSFATGDSIEADDVIKAVVGGVVGEVFDTAKGHAVTTTRSAVQSGKRLVAATTPPPPSVTRRINDQRSEMETARRRSAELADELRELRTLDSRPMAQKDRIDRVDPEERVFVPFEDARRLRESKVIDDDFWVKSGFGEQYPEALRTRGDFVILKSRLLEAKIAPEHIDDVARSTRAKPTDMTGHEGIETEQKWNKSLATLADRMEDSSQPEIDGQLIYRRTFERLTRQGAPNDIARQQSAFFALHYKLKAVENNAEGLSANQRFLRDIGEVVPTGPQTGASTDARPDAKSATDLRALPEAEGGNTEDESKSKRGLVIEITKPNRVPMGNLFD